MSKLLANRLAPYLQNLVSRAQSAFIKKRSIHDNFIYTQNIVKELHRAKIPSLFIKLDIAKAFDSVRWDYLLEVLRAMGFGHKWCNWISTLLATATTSVFLNGTRGKWFKHHTGLRQGDPLSPMLFILALEPLQHLFRVALAEGRIEELPLRSARFRMSLYADDAALFMNPKREEVTEVMHLLSTFGAASGLITNMTKSAVFPICCDNVDIAAVMTEFECPIKSFPCTYLGLPLHTRQLRRVDIQPLIDKVAARLPSWKGRFLNRAGRLTLVNSVLSSIPTYFLTVFPLQKWAIKQVDKIRRSFLWKGTPEANGGHCLVQWSKVKRPKKLGGLGVLDLEMFSRALRLRWLWFQWTESDRPWVGGAIPVNEVDKQLFRACTRVQLGNGNTAQFWESCWLDGRAPRDIAPLLYRLAWRKNLKVSDQLVNQCWTRGLWRMSTVEEMAQFVLLWDLVHGVVLNGEEDRIIWKFTADGLYTAKSAYEIQFRGSYCSFKPGYLWSAYAEPKHRFFSWLLVQEKILTADKLQARNWPCNPLCLLCKIAPESALHICLQCPYAQHVWELVQSWSHDLVRKPDANSTIEDWWTDSLQSMPKEQRRTKAAILIYTVWNLWNERNRRTFQGKEAEPLMVLQLIKEKIGLRLRACGKPCVP